LIITVDKASAARVTATRRREASEGASGTKIIDAVLNAEPYSVSAMRRFRQENGLPPALDDFTNRPTEFWRRAEAELRRTVTDIDERLGDLSRRRDQVWQQHSGCEPEPTESPKSGLLPFERRPDGQPIISDPLITRWVKARYALANTGGAYWQAGQMTQQDYVEVDRRFQLYFDLLPVGRMAEQFSDAEMRAMNLRTPDIRNVREGNWSQIKF
jgi:hypothetical protein